MSKTNTPPLTRKEAKSLLNKYNMTEDDRNKWLSLINGNTGGNNVVEDIIDFNVFSSFISNYPTDIAPLSEAKCIADIEYDEETKSQVRQELKKLITCISYNEVTKYSYSSSKVWFASMSGFSNVINIAFSRTLEDVPDVNTRAMSKYLYRAFITAFGNDLYHHSVSYSTVMPSDNHTAIGKIAITIASDITSIFEGINVFGETDFYKVVSDAVDKLSNDIIDNIRIIMTMDSYGLKAYNSTMNRHLIAIIKNYKLTSEDIYFIVNGVICWSYNNFDNLQSTAFVLDYDTASNTISYAQYDFGHHGLDYIIIENNVITEVKLLE